MAGTLSPSLSRSARLPTSDQSTQNSIGNAFSTAKRWVKNRTHRSGDGALSTIAANNTLSPLSQQTNRAPYAVLPTETWLGTLNEHGSFKDLINFSQISREQRAHVVWIIKQRFRPRSEEEFEQLYKLLLSKEAQNAYQNNPNFKMLLDKGPAQWAQNCNFVEIFKLLLLRERNQTNRKKLLNNGPAQWAENRNFVKFLKYHVFRKKIKPLTREELIRLKLPTLEAPANTASTLTETAANPSIPFSKAHSEYFLKLLPLLLTQKQKPNFEVFFTQVLPERIHGITPEEVIVNQLKENSSNSGIEYLYTCNMFIDDRIYPSEINRPIVFAIVNKKLDLLKELINKGFNINATNSANGQSALHYAATYPNNINIIKLLIDEKADLNKRDPCGITPLHLAAEWGHINNIKLLIQDGGANINLLDNEGFSALHYAAKQNRAEIVEWLIAHPDLDKTVSEQDHEVWDYVQEKGYSKIIKILEKDRNPISVWVKETLTQLSQIKIAASTSRLL